MSELIPPVVPPIVENPPPIEPPKDEAIPREVYERAKKDMLDYKNKMKELETRLDGLKLQGHKEKEDWKEVARIHEEKAKDLEGKYSGLKESLVSSAKITKLTEEAVKQGIRPEALPDLELIDFDELIVETTSTGKILVTGQDRAIAKLKILRPHWFSKIVPGINSSTPEILPALNGVVTLADLSAAEMQYKKTKSEADKKVYYDTIQKYKSQPQR